MVTPPPKTVQELIDRFNKIAGFTINELSNLAKSQIPNDLTKDKGWVGQLIEKVLGANAKNLSEPDFKELGIELKTIPINRALKAQESTYVCTAPIDFETANFFKSRVYSKLKHVLWVPVEAVNNKSLAERRIGTPFLWQPNKDELNILKSDWEELTEMLQCGQAHILNAKYGNYLHIRPKAASSKVMQKTKSLDGADISVVPKGFYLRTRFTNKVISNQFS